MVLGLCLMMIAYLIIRHRSKEVAHTQHKKNNVREERTAVQLFVNRMWKQRETVGSKLTAVLLVILVIIAIFDFRLALNMLQPSMVVGMIVFSFFYIMNDEGEEVEEEELQPENHKLRALLRLIDYREHPFSLGLLLFIIIVLTLLLSKQYGLMLSLETGGNPMYVMSLPTAAFILSGLSIACGFIYIIHYCDFFGLRQTEQGPYKLFQIHFYEIIICGASFFIWLFILGITWITG
ncbi:hypothetical protein Q5741_07360 [Paenibacillus sp. JX-17]|uniref:Uncharacterized protein n=2 Tax=Paenibacillus lacisoli TaxID=3064525 RepID=A0ABT9CBI6_9BACL|nr:hypothetical protein [Paenibacillus sp. JX-17]